MCVNQAGGYILPFVVMGTCLLVVGVFIYIVLPANVGEMPHDDSGIHEKRK